MAKKAKVWDGSAWQDLASAVTDLSSAVPTGVISTFAGSSAPTGYLLCDGTAINRTSYATLFSVIGTTYGVGDNSTTFNLPNLKGKIPVGRDSSQTEFDALGETGGSKTNTHNHYQSIGFDGSVVYYSLYTNQPRTKIVTINRGTSNTGYSSNPTRIDSTENEEINILQPYLVVNYIIKA